MDGWAGGTFRKRQVFNGHLRKIKINHQAIRRAYIVITIPPPDNRCQAS